MFHVDKMLRVVNDWRPLYEGERKKNGSSRPEHFRKAIESTR